MQVVEAKTFKTVDKALRVCYNKNVAVLQIIVSISDAIADMGYENIPVALQKMTVKID